MARIGDTVNPGLMRADTSGILRGAAMGGQAIGQGIASMASGLNKGIQKGSELAAFLKQTESQAKTLAEFLPEDSPFKEMAQGAAEFLSDPENRQSERIAAAQAFAPNIKALQMDFDAGLSKKAMAMQQTAADNKARFDAIGLPVAEAQARQELASAETQSAALADFNRYKDDSEGLKRQMDRRLQSYIDPQGYTERVSREDSLISEFESQQGMLLPAAEVERARMLKQERSVPGSSVPIIPREVEAISTDLGGTPGNPGILPPLEAFEPSGKDQATSYLRQLQGLQKEVGGVQDLSILQYRDDDPVTGDPVTHSFAKVKTGSGVELTKVGESKVRSNIEENQSKLEYLEDSTRQNFQQKSQQERVEAMPATEVLASTYVQGLNLLSAEKGDKVYTGFGAQLKASALRIGAALGIDSQVIKSANAEQLYVIFGEGVMAQIAKTKGAVSEKEMAYFKAISPGFDKGAEANKRLLSHQLKFLRRELQLGSMIMDMNNRNPPVRVAEINRQVAKFYDENRIVTDKEIEDALIGAGLNPEEEYEKVRGERMRPGRPDSSQAAPVRDRAEGFGDRFQNYRPPGQ